MLHGHALGHAQFVSSISFCTKMGHYFMKTKKLVLYLFFHGQRDIPLIKILMMSSLSLSLMF